MPWRAFTPSRTERALIETLCIVYGALILIALPWAQAAGPQTPQIILVSNVGIAVADFCTALLLGREYLRGGRTPVLILACAYLYSTVMALLQLAVFPGAYF